MPPNTPAEEVEAEGGILLLSPEAMAMRLPHGRYSNPSDLAHDERVMGGILKDWLEAHLNRRYREVWSAGFQMGVIYEATARTQPEDSLNPYLEKPDARS